MENKKKKAVGILPNYYWLKTHGYAALTRCMYLYPKKFSHIGQLSKKGRTVGEWVVVAEELEAKHGKLPNAQWLRNSKKYGSLINFISSYPEKFAHIKKDWKGGRKVDEWVLIAKRLEKEYGAIPIPSWLNSNGYGGLYLAIIKYPEKFKYIKFKDKSYKTLGENIKIAEKLEKEYGSLPNCQWLMKNSYSHVQCCLNNHPEQFAHIKRNKLFKTVREWVLFAEGMEKEKGILPYPGWLIKNRLAAMAKVMREHPDSFSHIKQNNKKGKDKKEHILTAEKLEKKYGELPYPEWLRKNGYSDLSRCIRRYPEKFSHIKIQSKKGKNSDQHLSEVLLLVEKFEGILPSSAWLRKNNYRNMDNCIMKHPEIFRGIKQKVYNFNTKNEFRIKTIGE